MMVRAFVKYMTFLEHHTHLTREGPPKENCPCPCPSPLILLPFHFFTVSVISQILLFQIINISTHVWKKFHFMWFFLTFKQDFCYVLPILFFALSCADWLCLSWSFVPFPMILSHASWSSSRHWQIQCLVRTASWVRQPSSCHTLTWPVLLREKGCLS
jgi:hypothetical protein